MTDRARVVFDGGPRAGDTDAIAHLGPVIGSGEEGGVYQRTAEVRDGLTVYRWQPLSPAEVDALLRGDLRASQERRE